MRRIRKIHVLVAAMAAALCVPASGVSSGSSGPSMIAKVAKGEGSLNLIAWDGYTQPQWVKPFVKATGCKVKTKVGNTSDEMVTLMRTGQYDAVSASGDASLRLILGKDVRAIDPKLIPDFNNFIPQLKSPGHNTVKAVHYGISLQWGPNTLLYNTKKVKPALGIKDPYELNQAQFNATVALLKKQRPLVKKYWASAGDEIDLFKNGSTTVGSAWPYQTITLQAAKAPVKDLIPVEGATGWADTWMISAKAKHPNCAVLWIKWVSTPKVQAQQAISFGETPANLRACAIMDKLSKGACAQYHANAPAAYFNSIKFWKTPVKDCGNGQSNCMDYTKWSAAWTDIKG